jgi:hypothetical protein
MPDRLGQFVERLIERQRVRLIERFVGVVQFGVVLLWALYTVHYGALVSVFIEAIIIAILIWGVGSVLTRKSKGVTLAASLIGAYVGAALYFWLPKWFPDLGLPAVFYLWLCATVGYHLIRGGYD